MADNLPNRFMQERRGGVCLHLTSLPGKYGIGEIGDAAFKFIDTLNDMNLGVWQFLPAGPTGFGNSPYQSLSTFAGNEMLIDLAGLVRAALLTAPEIQALNVLPVTEVDFEQLVPKKTALIQLAAKRFMKSAAADLKSEFDQFRDCHDRRWLHEYALFRVLKSRHAERQWLLWPEGFRDHDTAALRKFEARSGRALLEVKIVQFLFFHQWRKLQQYASEKGVLLFGDMPIYIALDSADAWARRQLLQVDEDGRPKLVAGVPPDYFSRDGQLWGNPVYDWDFHAAEKYRWWTGRIQHSLQIADLVRIDHFRGFESYFAIKPDADTARDGEWLKGPGDAIFHAFRDALGDISIVAEDLGLITPEVDALRRRQHLPGMKVLQFEVLRNDFDIMSIEEDCVCYTGTHDNDTTAGWYRAKPAGAANRKEISQVRRKIRDACDGRPATIHRDMIRLAFASRARLAIAPLQDFLGLGSEARMNTPGTIGNNWRWRVREDSLDDALTESVARLVDESQRKTLNQAGQLNNNSFPCHNVR